MYEEYVFHDYLISPLDGSKRKALTSNHLLEFNHTFESFWKLYPKFPRCCPSSARKVLDSHQNGYISNQLRKQNRKLQYQANYNVCKHCSCCLLYIHKRDTFCSHSCSASFNNKLRGQQNRETRKKKSDIMRLKWVLKYFNTFVPGNLTSKRRLNTQSTIHTHSNTCIICLAQFETNTKRVKTCSKQCMCKLLSQLKTEFVKLYPEKIIYNRNPHKQSFLERSFEEWLKLKNIPNDRKGYLMELWFRNKHKGNVYRADFVFPTIKLVVELDGKQHEQTIEKDKKRDEVLTQRGYTVVRITHYEFMKKLKLPLVTNLLTSLIEQYKINN